MVELPNNAKVLWDGAKQVEIIMPESQKGKLCGLCGNFDGDPDNDFQIGKNTADFDICPALAAPMGSWGNMVSP